MKCRRAKSGSMEGGTVHRGPCRTLCYDFLFLELEGWKEEGRGRRDDKSHRESLKILIPNFPGHEGGSERVELICQRQNDCYSGL